MRPAQDQQCHEEPHPQSRRNGKVPLQKEKEEEKANKEKRHQGKKVKIQWNLTLNPGETARYFFMKI